MIRWCGEDFPPEAAKFHFLAAGATGSGKTVLLRILMQSTLSEVGRLPNLRAIVYDPKQDFVPVLDSIVRGPNEPLGELSARVKILNPFDRRGVSWDVAADTKNPAVARQVAATLVPEDERSASPFFARAAQDIAYGVILSFIESGVDWTFRDLVLALSTDQATTKAVLELSPSNRNRVDTYFGPTNETNLSVWSTLQTKVARFEPIAAGFSRAAEAISLSDWIRDPEGSVIVLRTNQAIREAIDCINAVLFRRLSELILDLPDTSAHSELDRTWVYLDELRDAGKLDGLRSLLNMGRSKRCTVVLSFQDIEGLKATYGEHEALELTGQCANKAILRLEGPATADWASSLFGTERVYLTDTSTGVQSGSGAQISSGESVREVDRRKVLDSKFFSLPISGTGGAVRGIAKRFDQTKPIEFGMKPFPEVSPESESLERARQKIWRASPIDQVVPRDDRELFLEPWDASDIERLGLNVKPLASKRTSSRDRW